MSQRRSVVLIHGLQNISRLEADSVQSCSHDVSGIRVFSYAHDDATKKL
jgi:hypothetical protein